MSCKSLGLVFQFENLNRICSDNLLKKRSLYSSINTSALYGLLDL
jgi:hypothetical protein